MTLRRKSQKPAFKKSAFCDLEKVPVAYGKLASLFCWPQPRSIPEQMDSHCSSIAFLGLPGGWEEVSNLSTTEKGRRCSLRVILYLIKDITNLGEWAVLTHQDHYCEVYGLQHYGGQFGQHRPHLSPLASPTSASCRLVSICCTFFFACFFHLIPSSLCHLQSFLAYVNPIIQCSKFNSSCLSSMASFLAPLAQSQLFHWFLISVTTLGFIAENPTQTGLNNKGNL